jgi:hypothetical protein
MNEELSPEQKIANIKRGFWVINGAMLFGYILSMFRLYHAVPHTPQVMRAVVATAVFSGVSCFGLMNYGLYRKLRSLQGK